MKSAIDNEIDQLDYQIQELRGKLAELKRQRPAEPVPDYEFRAADGTPVRLSALFGERDELILVHNMGRECPYCTLWADGLTGFVPHFESRAAFVVTSPDPPEVQREFAAERGWNFRMVSAHGTTFVNDMGFVDPEEGFMPGVSIFQRRADGGCDRVTRAEFGPGDDFCAIWHFFELLPRGADGWEPMHRYPS